MSNYVKRWKLVDPYVASTDKYATYTFVQNPREMTNIFPSRSFTNSATTNGKLLVMEGSTPAQSWTFSGPIRHKSEVDALHYWCYRKKRRVRLIDHFGRTLTVLLQQLDITPSRRVNVYWSHEYTVTALVLAVSSPTITDAGPGPGDV